nr:uncharacterized protein LOC128698632 isoform X2 [Cherax quadricarinatus]
MECCKSLIQCVEQTGWRRNITTSPKWNHSGSQLQVRVTGQVSSPYVILVIFLLTQRTYSVQVVQAATRFSTLEDRLSLSRTNSYTTIAHYPCQG